MAWFQIRRDSQKKLSDFKRESMALRASAHQNTPTMDTAGHFQNPTASTPSGSEVRKESGDAGRFRNREVNELAEQTTLMAASAASETRSHENNLQKQITEVKAALTVASASQRDEVYPAHARGGSGNLFAMRYRNDTQRGASSNPRYDPAKIPSPGDPVHRFEYILKDSPFRPEQEGDKDGVNYFWDDSLWTAVPNGDVVIE